MKKTEAKKDRLFRVRKWQRRNSNAGLLDLKRHPYPPPHHQENAFDIPFSTFTSRDKETSKLTFMQMEDSEIIN